VGTQSLTQERGSQGNNSGVKVSPIWPLLLASALKLVMHV
jgi:hypothetical protein